MSKSPPLVGSNVVISSSTLGQGAAITDIPLDELNDHQHRDPTATAQDTPKSDRKGKGKAYVEDDNPVNELENYDLEEEMRDNDAVRMQERPRHENVFDDEYGADDSGGTSPGNGAYPPVGDDDLEERRVNEVRSA